MAIDLKHNTRRGEDRLLGDRFHDPPSPSRPLRHTGQRICPEVSREQTTWGISSERCECWWFLL